MNEPVLFNNYAIALLGIAIEENKVEEYRKELKILKEVLTKNPDFMYFLGDYETSLIEKYKAIDKTLFEFNKNIVSFIKIIVKNKRALFLRKIVKESIYRFNDYLHIEEGRIYLAKDIEKSDLDKIILAIEKNENARVELEKIIDPSLLGGFIVTIKDNVYDASLINKLDKMKSSLLGADYGN